MPWHRHTASPHVADQLTHVLVGMRKQPQVDATDCSAFTEERAFPIEARIVGVCHRLPRRYKSAIQ
jgi:hypothetical protein